MCNNKCVPRCSSCTKIEITNNDAGRDGLSAMGVDQLLGYFPLDGTYDEWRIWWREGAVSGMEDDLYDLISRVDIVEGKVVDNTTKIDQNATQISLKADKTVTDEIGIKIATIEAEQIVQAGLISSKVSQTDFDSLGNVVASQSTQISQNTTDISLKASQSDVDALTGQVNTHTTQISQNSQQISLKASQTDFDALGNRVIIAESNITQNTTDIGLRVTQGDIESNFSMTPNKIKLFSTEINMTGLVEFQSLDTSTQTYITTIDGGRIVTNTLEGDRIKVGTLTGDRLTANSITGDKIQAGTISGDKIQANSITADKLSVQDLEVRNLKTSNSGKRVEITSNTNSLQFWGEDSTQPEVTINTESQSYIEGGNILTKDVGTLRMANEVYLSEFGLHVTPRNPNYTAIHSYYNGSTFVVTRRKVAAKLSSFSEESDEFGAFIHRPIISQGLTTMTGTGTTAPSFSQGFTGTINGARFVYGICVGQS